MIDAYRLTVAPELPVGAFRIRRSRGQEPRSVPMASVAEVPQPPTPTLRCVGHSTPQEAALAGWAANRSARAHIVSVDVRGDRAEVIVDTEPSYPDWVYCVRRDDGWHETVSGNGPCIGWDDPDEIVW